jgi:hypothetical protein
MKKRVVPRSVIDTDVRWGFSHAKGWISGYKLYMVCSTDSVIVPLLTDVTMVNVSDKPVYKDLLTSPSSSTSSSSCLSPITLKRIYFVVADPGYGDKQLYDLSMAKGFQLVSPVRRYKNTPEERLKLVDFYQPPLGQVIYSRRFISIEPLIEHIKSVFRIDPVPARGHDRYVVPCC